MNFTCPEEQLWVCFGKVRLFSSLAEYEWRPVCFLVEKFWQACQNCNLSVQANILRTNDFWKKDMFFLIVFGLRGRFFENFEGNTSARLSSLQFFCPGEECEQKFFSWKIYFFVIFVFSLKKLAFPARKLHQGCHNGFLGIQRNVMGKKISEKFKYFFVPWPENFSASR